MFGGQFGFLLIIPLMVMSQEAADECSAPGALPIPQGILYVGVGYSIIEGNPEGDDLGTGGVDPGLKLQRRILQLTCEDQKNSTDDQYLIPDEVSFFKRNRPFETSSLSTFHGTERYTSILYEHAKVDGGYEGLTAGVKFAASERYKQIDKKISEKRSVFLKKEKIQNFATASYQTGKAFVKNFDLDNGFLRKACSLPVTYAEGDYMAFLDEWGTHVVIETTLGIREGKNLEETRSAFFAYAAKNVEGSLSASGSYDGFSSSVTIDMNTFSSGMSSEASFGKNHSSYTVGSGAMDEPISLRLMSMIRAFDPQFWGRLDEYIAAGDCIASFERSSVKANIETAVQGYAAWKNIEQSTNPDIRIPITWPDGVYGLPKSFFGCPDNANDFVWDQGHRIQTSEDPGLNYCSTLLNFGGWLSSGYLRQDFCMKTICEVDTISRWFWQPGSYCIYKYGPECPEGFESGHVRWDDGQYGSMYNVKEGVLPTGTYGNDTEINFCCRNDGATTRAIHLPTDNRFMLLANRDQCQMVHGMSVKKEWLFWDTDSNSEQSEVHPYNGLYDGDSGVRLEYCHYYVKPIVNTPEQAVEVLNKFIVDAKIMTSQ